MKKDRKDDLFNSSSDEPNNTFLEQYKLYISSQEKISDRRLSANKYFLSLNTGLIAFLGYLSHTGANMRSVIVIAALLAGIAICYLWYRILYSYKGLNTGKFAVIHKIEKRLSLSLYEYEWNVLENGNNKENYWPFTHIEVKIPWVFITLYTIILISVIPFRKLLEICS